MKVLINDIYANLKEISPDKLENVAIWGWTNEGLDLLTLAINERIELFVSEVQEKMQEYDWMYDLSKPFDGVKTTVFRDGVHLTNEGNKIIADKISDIIDDYYKGKGYRNSCEET